MTVEEILDRAARELALEGLEECGRMPEILEQEEHRKEALRKMESLVPPERADSFRVWLGAYEEASTALEQLQGEALYRQGARDVSRLVRLFLDRGSSAAGSVVY